MAMPRKRPLKDPKQPYAYLWTLEGKRLWVGHGKNNRGRPTCSACWSGRPAGLVSLLRSRATEIEVTIYPCESVEHARSLERRLIAFFRPVYNTAPGTGGYPRMHTESGLKRIRDAATGRKVPQDVRDGRRQRMIGNQQLLGHKPSEETRAKLSAANKGRPVSDLCRQKSSERTTARNRTNPPRKGKTCSEEHRRKLSEAAKRRSRNASGLPECE